MIKQETSAFLRTEALLRAEGARTEAEQAGARSVWCGDVSVGLLCGGLSLFVAANFVSVPRRLATLGLGTCLFGAAYLGAFRSLEYDDQKRDSLVRAARWNSFLALHGTGGRGAVFADFDRLLRHEVDRKQVMTRLFEIDAAQRD